MTTIKNIRPDKGSIDDNPFYKWDVVSNDKSGTFYTDRKGENIWQEGVEPNKTQIYNSTVMDPIKKEFCINVYASPGDIKKQLQDFANKGFFDKYLK